jgi:hypothetical protein
MLANYLVFNLDAMYKNPDQLPNPQLPEAQQMLAARVEMLVRAGEVAAASIDELARKQQLEVLRHMTTSSHVEALESVTEPEIPSNVVPLRRDGDNVESGVPEAMTYETYGEGQEQRDVAA